MLKSRVLTWLLCIGVLALSILFTVEHSEAGPGVSSGITSYHEDIGAEYESLFEGGAIKMQSEPLSSKETNLKRAAEPKEQLFLFTTPEAEVRKEVEVSN